MFPPQPRLAEAPRLREPLYFRQDGESDADWEAFGAWVDCRDWHRVGAVCGLTQQAALETATRWAWHARTRAWDAEHESQAASERKAHAAAVLVARQALPEVLGQQVALLTDLQRLAQAEIVRHSAAAEAFATGSTGDHRPTYLPFRELLATFRVTTQAARDLAAIARPIGPDTLGEVSGKEGQWDYSKVTGDALKAIQLARAASKV